MIFCEDYDAFLEEQLLLMDSNSGRLSGASASFGSLKLEAVTRQPSFEGQPSLCKSRSSSLSLASISTAATMVGLRESVDNSGQITSTFPLLRVPTVSAGLIGSPCNAKSPITSFKELRAAMQHERASPNEHSTTQNASSMETLAGCRADLRAGPTPCSGAQSLLSSSRLLTVVDYSIDDSTTPLSSSSSLSARTSTELLRPKARHWMLASKSTRDGIPFHQQMPC